MLKRFVFALALACLSLRGVAASYRDSGCIKYLEKHARHSHHSMKEPCGNPTPSPSPQPSESIKPSISEYRGYAYDETATTMTIPEFQLDFTLETRRKLRILTDDTITRDDEIENLVNSYFKSQVDYPLEVRLERKQTVEGSSNVIFTFMGDYDYIREIFNEAKMAEMFDENNNHGFLDSVQDVGLMTRVKDVVFSLIIDAGHTSEQQGGGAVSSSEGLKSSDHQALIIGAMAAVAALAMFSYAYRRRNRNEKEYELAGNFQETIENDLDPTDLPENLEREMMRSLGICNGTSLSGIATAGPVRSGLSYLGAAAKSWSARGSSMSDLAAGATQEEFIENGMKVDIYGSHQKKKKPSPSKYMMLKKHLPRGRELSTDLEPIVEVNSAASVGSSSKNGESWQKGKKEINDAPPLLPALSVSSAPSDETPLNDISNFFHDNALAPPSIGTPDFDISFNTPMAATPHDSMNIEGMTPYGNMSGVSGSPNLSQNIYAADETPLQMRCLKFDDGSDFSDFTSSDKSDKSINSCLKDMMGAINPENSDSSSDGCVKDMLADIDDCAVKLMNDVSLSRSEPDNAKENEGAQLDPKETSINHGLVKDFSGSDISATVNIDDLDMDQSVVCPPEVNVDREKMVITDEVSGKSEGGSKDDVDFKNVETLRKVAQEKNYDGVPLAELSTELSDSESDTISLITIDQFRIKK